MGATKGLAALGLPGWTGPSRSRGPMILLGLAERLAAYSHSIVPGGFDVTS
jgi:hypothetical protein